MQERAVCVSITGLRLGFRIFPNAAGELQPPPNNPK